MRSFVYILTLCTIWSTQLFAQEVKIDSSEDEKKVKEAVVKWADETFYMHKEYKFEKFHAFYTEEYEIAYMRTNARKEMMEDLEKDKAAGRYRKSEEEYQKEHKLLEDDYLKFKGDLDKMTQKVNYYQISFWSNIQTNDGITVYYEHIVKLTNDFMVNEATINSAIGKKSENTQIVYKADVNAKKKVGPDNLRGQGDKTNEAKPVEGSVTIITTPNENDLDKKDDTKGSEGVQMEETTVDRRKKKDKKKKK
ncbi:MAG: hypothetical protein R2780_07545 [Crocinitomicaceae bacterium]